MTVVPVIKDMLLNDPLEIAIRSENDFEVWISWEIGPEDEEGAAIFQHAIVSKSVLEQLAPKPDGPQLYLEMERYDETVVERWVEARCAECSAPTWEEAAKKLMQWFTYEFDY